MKILNYTRGLWALTLALLLAIGFISSCTKEETNDKVVLQSFGPSGVNHGDKIEFIGLNLNKVTSIVLPSVEIPASAFVSQSPKLIELIVPEEAGAGKVILKTPQGDIESKSMLSFNVPVEITSITPEAKPGTNITIIGKYVNWITKIVFEDGQSVETFVSSSVTQLVVQVPLGAQTGFLIFSSGGTKPLSFASKDKLIVTLPTVSSISPTLIKQTDNLTITGTDLDLITSIVFKGDKTATEFASKTATQIVVAVPVGALDGTITLKQTSPIDVVTSDALTIILPKGTSLTPKPAKPGVDNITITGTNLDLVASLTFSGVTDPVDAANFVSQSATQIVVAVPAAATAGGIKYTTEPGYTNNLGVTLVLPGAGPPPLAVLMYDETIPSGGGNWSWSGTADPASTEQFYSGNVSWKFESTGGGGASVGGMDPIDASGEGVFVFSLYGGLGTEGLSVAAILGDDVGDQWGSYNAVTLHEGKCTEYRIPLTSYATVNLQKVKRWIFKPETGNPSTIYVDRVGFDPAGPTPLAITMFDESISFGGGNWSWGGTGDAANTEHAYSGTISFKHTTSGNDGGASIGGMTGVDASSKTVFKFSLYGGPGMEGKSVAAILGSDGADKWDSYNSVTIHEGVWTEYSIPLTSYATVNFSNVTRWIFKAEGSTDAVIFVDRVGFD